MVATPELLKKRGIPRQSAEKINHLHSYREYLEEERANGHMSKTLFDKLWTQNENYLQKLWKFPIDPSRHKFWASKYCSCPKLDNEERMGTGNFIINSECLLHGDQEFNEKPKFKRKRRRGI